jgi:hypothetical protein
MMFQFLVALRARRRLARLRSELSGPFAGKRALVVGSAPGLVVPAKYRFDLALCVNGSGFPARALGIDRPALTVVSGFSTRSDSHLRKETHRAWRGLETDCLVLVASGRRARRERRVIEAAGLRFERFVLLSAE